MNLSELILERKIANISIGDNLKDISNLEITTHQDGDIPALYGLYIDDLFFEIIVIDNIIRGIQFDFSYEIAAPNTFEVNDIKMILDENTSIVELANHLKKLNFEFEIIESKFESKKIRLEKYKTNFYFDDRCNKLFKLSNIDFDLLSGFSK
ncbi:hypothetical protein F3J23_11675 [Chryseobacterium sp. Tr-659]|uniref:hypothetical protein n=1 Tax=Chryseobacterium sp. Tr-659 TaxID=2608340 RepID=UPI0014204B83|nr:hypothetical protein [Chryseobacterium sp. Tr-659]NIF06099.1 hypothetical protein [Chryseobacterium sp. Tr-659]